MPLPRRTSRRLAVGTALAAALCAPAASASAQSPFAAERLVARADSFAILVQGVPRGFMTESIARTGDGFRLTSRQAIQGMMSQETEVTFSPALEMGAVRQAGEARGQTMKIDVGYGGGRARGTATTPGQEGMKTVTVDAALPAGAVDDNALLALVATIPLTEGASYRVPVFASGQGKSLEMTLVVGAAERVTVRAGTFEAVPVTITGGMVPLTVHVSTGAAPRVIRMTMASSPLSFELAAMTTPK